MDTVKSLLEAHALIEAHSPVWTLKMPIFQANISKNRASNKGPPTNIERKLVLSYAETSQMCYKQQISSRPSPERIKA